MIPNRLNYSRSDAAVAVRVKKVQDAVKAHPEYSDRMIGILLGISRDMVFSAPAGRTRGGRSPPVIYHRVES